MNTKTTVNSKSDGVAVELVASISTRKWIAPNEHRKIVDSLADNLMSSLTTVRFSDHRLSKMTVKTRLVRV